MKWEEMKRERRAINVLSVDFRLKRTMESLRFSPRRLDLGLAPAEPTGTPGSLGVPPAGMDEPEQVRPSPLALFSTFTRTVWRLRADGGGRSPKSFTDTFG